MSFFNSNSVGSNASFIDDVPASLQRKLFYTIDRLLSLRMEPKSWRDADKARTQNEAMREQLRTHFSNLENPEEETILKDPSFFNTLIDAFNSEHGHSALKPIYLRPNLIEEIGREKFDQLMNKAIEKPGSELSLEFLKRPNLRNEIEPEVHEKYINALTDTAVSYPESALIVNLLNINKLEEKIGAKRFKLLISTAVEYLQAGNKSLNLISALYKRPNLESEIGSESLGKLKNQHAKDFTIAEEMAKSGGIYSPNKSALDLKQVKLEIGNNEYSHQTSNFLCDAENLRDALGSEGFDDLINTIVNNPEHCYFPTLLGRSLRHDLVNEIGQNKVDIMVDYLIDNRDRVDLINKLGALVRNDNLEDLIGKARVETLIQGLIPMVKEKDSHVMSQDYVRRPNLKQEIGEDNFYDLVDSIINEAKKEDRSEPIIARTLLQRENLAKELDSKRYQQLLSTLLKKVTKNTDWHTTLDLLEYPNLLRDLGTKKYNKFISEVQKFILKTKENKGYPISNLWLAQELITQPKHLDRFLLSSQVVPGLVEDFEGLNAGVQAKFANWFDETLKIVTPEQASQIKKDFYSYMPNEIRGKMQTGMAG